MRRAKVVSIARFESLVDANAIARIYGRSSQWVNGLARRGLIRWHGVKNGAKVWRRFDPAEVRQDLAHDKQEPEVRHAGS